MNEKNNNIEQILEDLTPKVRYRAIAFILQETKSGFIGYEEHDQISNSIPTSMMIEAIENLPTPKRDIIDDDYFTDDRILYYISRESFKRKDEDLMIASAERLVKYSEIEEDLEYLLKAGSLYEQVPSEQNNEKSANCYEKSARIFKHRFDIRRGGER